MVELNPGANPEEIVTQNVEIARLQQERVFALQRRNEGIRQCLTGLFIILLTVGLTWSLQQPAQTGTPAVIPQPHRLTVMTNANAAIPPLTSSKGSEDYNAYRKFPDMDGPVYPDQILLPSPEIEARY